MDKANRIDLETALICTLIKWEYYAKTGGSLADVCEEYPLLKELEFCCGLCEFSRTNLNDKDCTKCPIGQTPFCTAMIPYMNATSDKTMRKIFAKCKYEFIIHSINRYWGHFIYDR